MARFVPDSTPFMGAELDLSVDRRQTIDR
jgi:hypothetical protein